jgi:hypothetical protein
MSEFDKVSLSPAVIKIVAAVRDIGRNIVVRFENEISSMLWTRVREAHLVYHAMHGKTILSLGSHLAKNRTTNAKIIANRIPFKTNIINWSSGRWQSWQ